MLVHPASSFFKNKLHFCVVLACGGGGCRKRLLYAVTLKTARWSVCGPGLDLSGRVLTSQARGPNSIPSTVEHIKIDIFLVSSSKRMSKVTTWDVKLVNSYLKAEGLKTLWELQPPTKGSTVFLGGCGCLPHISGISGMLKQAVSREAKDIWLFTRVLCLEKQEALFSSL